MIKMTSYYKYIFRKKNECKTLIVILVFMFVLHLYYVNTFCFFQNFFTGCFSFSSGLFGIIHNE